MQATQPAQPIVHAQTQGHDPAAENRELQAKIQELMAQQLQNQKRNDELKHRQNQQNRVNNQLQRNVQQLRRGFWGRIAKIAAAVAVVAAVIFFW